EEHIRILQFTKEGLEVLHRLESGGGDAWHESVQNLDHVSEFFEGHPRAVEGGDVPGIHFASSFHDLRESLINGLKDRPALAATPFRADAHPGQMSAERSYKFLHPARFHRANAPGRVHQATLLPPQERLAQRARFGERLCLLFE